MQAPQLIVNPADAKDFPDAHVAQPMPTATDYANGIERGAGLTPMERLGKAADAGVTPAGRMAVALTMVRNKNSRVLGGTALASPIFAGLDNDLSPEHRAARQDARRKARKVRRTARKAHR